MRTKHFVAFSTDRTSAYLFLYSPEGDDCREMCSVVARWFLGRSDVSTFDPACWRLKTAFEGVGGTFYDAEPVKGYW